MTGKHFGWHKHWLVDISTASVTHDSGLVVSFVAGLSDPPPEVGTLAYTKDGREWTGSLHGLRQDKS